MVSKSRDPLLQPLVMRHLILKNRIMVTAHEPGYHIGGLPSDRTRNYIVERAKGGVALCFIGGSAVVARDSSPAHGNLHAFRDEIIAPLRAIANECRSHGCATMVQLTHLGRRTWDNMADWLPAVSPSTVREPAHRIFAKEMEAWDIERVINDYATAAERMAEAGLDGVEFECSGHLAGAFLSPATNHRTDEFGGSVENRLRFVIRLLEAVRLKVGPKLLLGCRLVCDEDSPDGLTAEDGMKMVRMLTEGGYVDFLNVIRGRLDDNAATAKLMPILGMPSAPHLDFVGTVREQTHLPIFHAGKIADVATARYAVATGKLDMVGMTRAHIADPHIVHKIASGEENRIRPCVGANYCMDRLVEGNEALCIHNAATGREGSFPQVITPTNGPKRRVVIVGAGPAGLEAARVSAERGHEVTVLEAQSAPGGQVSLATRLRRRTDMNGIIDWRVEECRRLGVQTRYNILASAKDVLALSPDIVVVATGGLPNPSGIEDGEPLLTSSWDIISGQITPGKDVLVFDDHGGHQGLAAAEYLCEAGAKVEIVTPERNFAPNLSGLNLVPYMERFAKSGALITTMTRVSTVTRQGNKLAVKLVCPMAETVTGERLVDQVVYETGTTVEASLYEDLLEFSSNRGVVDQAAFIAGKPQTVNVNPSAKMQLFRIGDAVASRNIHVAIYDGLRLCRAF